MSLCIFICAIDKLYEIINADYELIIFLRKISAFYNFFVNIKSENEKYF